MKLLIDIGNSRLKWALVDQGQLVPGENHAHLRQPESVLSRLPELEPEAIWIASVAGADLETGIDQVLRARWPLVPRFARSQAQCMGLTNVYPEPQRLGVDRWLAMLAAWSHFRRAILVVDAGTALTVDGVDGDGRHLGGLIAPGLGAAQGAVLGTTRFGGGDGDFAFGEGLGRDTQSCVRQGALLACSGAIDRAAALVAANDPVQLITGGDAGLLLPFLHGGWQHRPLLVLEGLAVLADQEP